MHNVDKGKKMVIILIAVVLLIDIITIAGVTLIYASRGMMDVAGGKLTQGVFRFILTSVILFFLYEGHRWAKWLMAALFLLAGSGSLYTVMGKFNVILLGMGLVYVLSSIVLVLSRSVNDFFRYQREGIIPERTEDEKY